MQHFPPHYLGFCEKLFLMGFSVMCTMTLAHYHDIGTSVFPLCWAAGALHEELLPMDGLVLEKSMDCLLWEAPYAGAGAGVLPLRRKERQRQSVKY